MPGVDRQPVGRGLSADGFEPDTPGAGYRGARSPRRPARRQGVHPKRTEAGREHGKPPLPFRPAARVLGPRRAEARTWSHTVTVRTASAERCFYAAAAVPADTRCGWYTAGYRNFVRREMPPRPLRGRPMAIACRVAVRKKTAAGAFCSQKKSHRRTPIAKKEPTAGAVRKIAGQARGMTDTGFIRIFQRKRLKSCHGAVRCTTGSGRSARKLRRCWRYLGQFPPWKWRATDSRGGMAKHPPLTRQGRGNVFVAVCRWSVMRVH